ncbi:alpha-galactosidase A precursor [Penicillium subrubescens]|uniref:alpha-galactosidase A precursor n=1 Tax=Penicillium subrubescens TaxID=1316194 RepID=UPI0025459B76|nr:alpha-galactosidase A precursor [Penicillium subrubescens]KAJ5881026.1 alpha-galactosidase A precursor [Penicillium subrubescens]
MATQSKMEPLQAEVDESDQSFFRLLVNGPSEDMCCRPSLISLLPKLFLPGDWNDGLVALDAKGRPHFISLNQTQFPSVKNTWHETFVDYVDLSIGRRLRTGIYEAKCPLFEDDVVVKFARFHWEIQYIENETTAYQWISGHTTTTATTTPIAPRFLGHLTEIGRDLQACRGLLSRLHDLGVRHGDTNRFNFLIRDSKAILIDFDTAKKCDDRDLLLPELDSLTACFEDSSGRGGEGPL